MRAAHARALPHPGSTGKPVMRLGGRLVDGLRPVADLLYPPRCPLCGAAIEAQSGLCTGCWRGLEMPGEPSCAMCQRPFGDATMAGSVCAPCMADPPRHSGIAAATLYNETSRQLVLRFKHGGRITLASMMARQILSALGQVPEDALIVPVPLHRWRIWRRGYNQAALLAQELGKLAQREVSIDALRRTKPTPSLGGLGRKARARVLSGAIGINPACTVRVAGRHVVLVDDVLTSGATTDTCTRVLLRAGAASVRISCFARVLDDTTLRPQMRLERETPEATGTSGAT